MQHADRTALPPPPPPPPPNTHTRTRTADRRLLSGRERHCRSAPTWPGLCASSCCSQLASRGPSVRRTHRRAGSCFGSPSPQFLSRANRARPWGLVMLNRRRRASLAACWLPEPGSIYTNLRRNRSRGGLSYLHSGGLHLSLTDALQASCSTGYWARSRRCSSGGSSRRSSPCTQSRRWVPAACLLSCLRGGSFAARGCRCPRGCPPPPLFVLLVCVLGGLCAAALRQRGAPSIH